jgi:ATP-binding cassette subfamily C protein
LGICFSGFDVKMDSHKKVLGFAMNGVKKDARLLVASLLVSLMVY